MIRGNVTARRAAVVAFRVRGPGGVTADIDAVVDTGFTGTLTLPSATAAALGLLRVSTGTAILADGSQRWFDVYKAELYWDGRWRTVSVSAVGSEILIGMRLLDGHELRVEAKPGGAVEIRPLP